MVKKSTKSTKKSNIDHEAAATKMTFIVASLAAVSLVILGILAMYS